MRSTSPGDRVQDATLADLGAKPTANATHGPHRLARRLAGRVAGCRPGHRRTDGLAGRGPADLLAVRSPGPVVRQHHRSERAGQHDRHRICTGHQGFRRRPGSRQMSAPLREHGIDIDMPSLIYAGERSHVIDYLRAKAGMSSAPRGPICSSATGSRFPPPRTTIRWAKSSTSAGLSAARSATPPPTARWHRSTTARPAR